MNIKTIKTSTVSNTDVLNNTTTTITRLVKIASKFISYGVMVTVIKNGITTQYKKIVGGSNKYAIVRKMYNNNIN